MQAGREAGKDAGWKVGKDVKSDTDSWADSDDEVDEIEETAPRPSVISKPQVAADLISNSSNSWTDSEPEDEPEAAAAARVTIGAATGVSKPEPSVAVSKPAAEEHIKSESESAWSDDDHIDSQSAANQKTPSPEHGVTSAPKNGVTMAHEHDVKSALEREVINAPEHGVTSALEHGATSALEHKQQVSDEWGLEPKTLAIKTVDSKPPDILRQKSVESTWSDEEEGDDQTCVPPATGTHAINSGKPSPVSGSPVHTPVKEVVEQTVLSQQSMPQNSGVVSQAGDKPKGNQVNKNSLLNEIKIQYIPTLPIKMKTLK